MDHADRHLWEFRWVRDLAMLLATALLIWTAYTIRAITVPVLVGFGLAYAVNPIICAAKKYLRLPRWLSTILILLIGLGIISGMFVYIGPRAADQMMTLARNTPRYITKVTMAVERLMARASQAAGGQGAPTTQTMPAEDAATRPEAQTAPVEPVTETHAVTATAATTQPGKSSSLALQAVSSVQNIDISTIGSMLTRSLNVGIDVVSSAISTTSYLLLFVVVVGFCFFFFSWRLNAIAEWFHQFIPDKHRQQVLSITGKMDQSVSAYIRCQMIDAFLVGTILSIGWLIAGVPYWLLLGMISGFLNLIPYAAIIGWPVAVLLTWADRAAGDGSFSVWAVFVWPTVVYMIAQSVDGWVIQPLVQGKVTNLDPLSVLLAVLIGGSLAGLLGMILAIPVAACLKILAQEIIIPRLKSYVNTLD